MRRLLLILGVGLAFAAPAGSSTVAHLTPAQAFADLNRWRAESGELPVRSFTAANNSACALHDRYMMMLGRLVHQELPGSPGYTAAGAASGPNDVLAFPEGLPKAMWVDPVYHRLSILQPRLRVSGFAAAWGYVCMRTAGLAVDDSKSARTSRLTLYPWPPRGATDQPVTFGTAAYETPSPLADVPGATSLGLLLSVNVNGPWANHSAASSTLRAASLVSSSGAHVPLAVSDSSSTNHRYLSGGFALLPLDALTPGTSYAAYATGQVSAEGVTYPFALTWHFTTAS